MTEARKKLDAAISELLDQYEAEEIEPVPTARKIDHPAFDGWHIANDDGRVFDADKWNVNGLVDHQHRGIRSGLIVVAPDLMRDVIDLVNGYSPASCDPYWLSEKIGALRERIIAAGFECDLE